jgi:hypothetical protein
MQFQPGKLVIVTLIFAAFYGTRRFADISRRVRHRFLVRPGRVQYKINRERKNKGTGIRKASALLERNSIATPPHPPKGREQCSGIVGIMFRSRPRRQHQGLLFTIA